MLFRISFSFSSCANLVTSVWRALYVLLKFYFVSCCLLYNINPLCPRFLLINFVTTICNKDWLSLEEKLSNKACYICLHFVYIFVTMGSPNSNFINIRTVLPFLGADGAPSLPVDDEDLAY